MGHNSRAHALLSASKSSRWINCTPSARLEEHIPDTPSLYAAEGTLAHELAQLYLEGGAIYLEGGSMDADKYDEQMDQIYNHYLFQEEMLEEVPKYVDYCEEAFLTAKTETEDAIMEIEQKIDFSKYVPDGFGTADCVIIADGTMEVIDLKYGKGVLVEAEDNTQALLYALGAYDKFSLMYDINFIKMTIVQPRRNNISSWTISVDYLFDWVKEVLVSSAELAWAGEGQQIPGDWCKFCKVKAQCRALAEQSLALAKTEFKQEPYLLAESEIADILEKGPLVLDWVNAVKEYAFNEAVAGRKSWPGFKLVAGVSRRRWTSEVEAEERLKDLNIPENEIYITKLQPLTTIEKALGKKHFAEVMQDVVIKPEGAPTLVPISDKRPALGTEQAKLDFQ